MKLTVTARLIAGFQRHQTRWVDLPVTLSFIFSLGGTLYMAWCKTFTTRFTDLPFSNFFRGPPVVRRCGLVWPVMAWYGMAWRGMVWYGMVWFGMVWYGMVWYGMVWYGMEYGMEYGKVWYG